MARRASIKPTLIAAQPGLWIATFSLDTGKEIQRRPIVAWTVDGERVEPHAYGWPIAGYVRAVIQLDRDYWLTPCGRNLDGIADLMAYLSEEKAELDDERELRREQGR